MGCVVLKIVWFLVANVFQASLVGFELNRIQLRSCDLHGFTQKMHPHWFYRKFLGCFLIRLSVSLWRIHADLSACWAERSVAADSTSLSFLQLWLVPKQSRISSCWCWSCILNVPSGKRRSIKCRAFRLVQCAKTGLRCQALLPCCPIRMTLLEGRSRRIFSKALQSGLPNIRFALRGSLRNITEDWMFGLRSITTQNAQLINRKQKDGPGADLIVFWAKSKKCQKKPRTIMQKP